MNEGEFYLDGDSGYKTLVHEPCNGHVAWVDSGDTLAQINTWAREHTCEEVK